MTRLMKQGDRKLGLPKSKLLLWTIVVVILLLSVLSIWSKLSFIRDQLIALAQIIAVVLLLLIAVDLTRSGGHPRVWRQSLRGGSPHAEEDGVALPAGVQGRSRPAGPLLS